MAAAQGVQEPGFPTRVAETQLPEPSPGGQRSPSPVVGAVTGEVLSQVAFRLRPQCSRVLSFQALVSSDS